MNNADNVYVGDTVMCSADAYPPVTMIILTAAVNNGSAEWTFADWSNTPSLSYKLTDSGNYSINCTAINYLLGGTNRPCSNSSVIDLYAISICKYSFDVYFSHVFH
jgi:hypothetical protein